MNAGTCGPDLLSVLWQAVRIPQLGLGNDPHSKQIEMEWPTAYAILLSALIRYIPEKLDHDISPVNGAGALRRHCAEWLLSHQKCAASSLPVWTLPYQRKIWMDEEPGIANTGFNVPTVHGIQAMCEIARCEPDISVKCLKSAELASHAWASHCSTRVGTGLVFWYSTRRNHSYHVNNAISLMAGELQRTASTNCNGHERLRETADEAVSYILKQKRKDIKVPTWDYFGARIPENKFNRNNDLLHEAFVCQGLMTYKDHGGTHAGSIDQEDLIDALVKFYHTGTVFDFPETEMNERRRRQPARAIGLAQALYVVTEIYRHSSNARASDFADILVNEIRTHIIKSGRILVRRGGEDISTYIRTRAHLILALSNNYATRTVGTPVLS